MSGASSTYNLANIYKLLVSAFTAKELERFCYHRLIFRPVVDLFGTLSSLEDMADEVVRYCERRGLFAELLGEIKQYNSYQWERWGPYAGEVVAARVVLPEVTEYDAGLPVGVGQLRYLERPTDIRSARQNKWWVESSFLHWPECTVLLWVHVPAKGQRLRNSLNHRYLLSHYNDEVRAGLYKNQLGLRHASARDRWELVYSNDQGGAADPYLIIEDRLEPGWHQFMIAWNNEKPLLRFAIDGNEGGKDSSTSYLAFWPEKLSEKVTVGAWPTDYLDGGYCETEIAHLWILDRFFEASGRAAKDHLRFKPQPE